MPAAFNASPYPRFRGIRSFHRELKRSLRCARPSWPSGKRAAEISCPLTSEAIVANEPVSGTVLNQRPHQASKTSFMRAIIATLFFIVCAAPILLVAANEARRQIDDERNTHGNYIVSFRGCNDCHTPLKFTGRGTEPDLVRTLSELEASAMRPVSHPAHTPGLVHGRKRYS